LIRMFLADKLDNNNKKLQISKSSCCQQRGNPYPVQHDIQSQNDPQMSLDYHLVDPLGDDEQDEQQSDVLDGC
jgi:hypothetical protein